MTDSSGQVVWAADYKPFGEAAIDQLSTITSNLRGIGQYFDVETGLLYTHWGHPIAPLVKSKLTSLKFQHDS